MEAKAFGEVTGVIIDGTNETTITTVGTNFLSFFIIALDNDVSVGSIILKWPLAEDIRATLLPGGDTANITDSVVLPVGGQLGGLKSCVVAAASGKFQVLFFTN